ncbi:MAG: YbaK/EbsC family protein [Chromatiaceae bacterium]
MSYQLVLHLLEASGVAYNLHTHPPIRTVEEAEERFQLPTTNLAKTVVFRIKEGDWVLAAVRGRDRIHYKALADALGVRRTDLRAIGPDEVETELGFEVGGVGPFPVREDLRVLFDRGALALECVVCGSGRNTVSVEIATRDLIALATGPRPERRIRMADTPC